MFLPKYLLFAKVYKLSFKVSVEMEKIRGLEPGLKVTVA
jgi:hypothetical protein